MVQVLDVFVCSASFINVASITRLSTTIPRVTLGVTLLILALISTLKQLVEMYRATKQWQPNKYMQLLMREGILYFLVYVTPFQHFQFPLLPSFVLPIITPLSWHVQED